MLHEVASDGSDADDVEQGAAMGNMPDNTGAEARSIGAPAAPAAAGAAAANLALVTLSSPVASGSEMSRTSAHETAAGSNYATLVRPRSMAVHVQRLVCPVGPACSFML